MAAPTPAQSAWPVLHLRQSKSSADSEILPLCSGRSLKWVPAHGQEVGRGAGGRHGGGVSRCRGCRDGLHDGFLSDECRRMRLLVGGEGVGTEVLSDPRGGDLCGSQVGGGLGDVHLDDDPAFERLWEGRQRAKQVDVAAARLGPDGKPLAGRLMIGRTRGLGRAHLIGVNILEVHGTDTIGIPAHDPNRVHTGPGQMTGVGAKPQDGLLDATQDRVDRELESLGGEHPRQGFRAILALLVMAGSFLSRAS
jgi:hypothetical protein